MDSNQPLTDEYLATLLAQDAKRASARYAAEGLSALIPRRRAGAAGQLKPNTRFLERVVRGVDGHNRALRERERESERERDRESKRARRERERDRSRSPRAHHRPRRDRDDEGRERRHHRHRHRRRHNGDDEVPVQRRRSRSRSPAEKLDPDEDEEEEETIGPRPAGEAVRQRGRGHAASASVLNSRPGVLPDKDGAGDGDGGDDWDRALEHLRDRRAWRDKQAQRLRDGGFSDGEIRAWQGRYEDMQRGEAVENVKWRKRGEEREWDRGKVRVEDDDEDEPNNDDDDGNDNNDDQRDATPRRRDRRALDEPRAEKPPRRQHGGGRAEVSEGWKGKESPMVRGLKRALG